MMRKPSHHSKNSLTGCVTSVNTKDDEDDSPPSFLQRLRTSGSFRAKPEGGNRLLTPRRLPRQRHGPTIPPSLDRPRLPSSLDAKSSTLSPDSSGSPRSSPVPRGTRSSTSSPGPT